MKECYHVCHHNLMCRDYGRSIYQDVPSVDRCPKSDIVGQNIDSLKGGSGFFSEYELLECYVCTKSKTYIMVNLLGMNHTKTPPYLYTHFII